MQNAPFTPLGILGNTEAKIPINHKREKQVKNYCFTYNNYNDESVIKLKNTLNTLGKWLFGYEVGESGTKHLQGFIILNSKKSLTKLIKDINIKEIHLEQCKGSQKDNETYCTKDKNYDTNYFIEDEPLEIISNLAPWMIEIENIIKSPADKRKVLWYWELKGGVGKSSFCKYLCVHYNAIYIDEGKKSDIINIIYNIPKINSRSVIVIDVPRANKNVVSYKAIEQIKNGMICNTKYETGMKLFNPPHIIIFSNYPPNTDELSEDRWHIVEIENTIETNNHT